MKRHESNEHNKKVKVGGIDAPTNQLKEISLPSQTKNHSERELNQEGELNLDVKTC